MSGSEPARPMSVAKRPRRLGLIATVAAVVVAVDAITKLIAAHALAHRGIVSIYGGLLHLELYRNHAGPGNMLEGHPVLVSVFSIAATLLLCGFALSVRGRWFAVAVGLLLGGAVGNLLDRIFGAPGPLRGGVIDWLKPTLSSGSMNLADLAINLGVLVMLLAAAVEWWGERGARRDRARDRPGGGELIGGGSE